MPVTSTSAYAPRHQQYSLEHSPIVRNLPPSLVSRQHLSRTIYLAPPPPTKDTCADTDLTPPPHEILKITLSQHVQRSITCPPNMKLLHAGCILFCHTSQHRHWHNVHRHHRCIPCLVIGVEGFRDTRILLHVVGIIVLSIVLDHVLQNFQYLDTFLIDYSMILPLTHIF